VIATLGWQSCVKMATGNSPSEDKPPSPSPRGGNFTRPRPREQPRGVFLHHPRSPAGISSPRGSPSPHKTIYTGINLVRLTDSHMYKSSSKIHRFIKDHRFINHVILISLINLATQFTSKTHCVQASRSCSSHIVTYIDTYQQLKIYQQHRCLRLQESRCPAHKHTHRHIHMTTYVSRCPAQKISTGCTAGQQHK
jgi:hypothetical protein